jgi:hypothetical protein
MNSQEKRAVRRRTDLALSRAEYAVGLLAHPSEILDVDELVNTLYGTLQELAVDATAVFWDQR